MEAMTLSSSLLSVQIAKTAGTSVARCDRWLKLWTSLPARRVLSEDVIEVGVAVTLAESRRALSSKPCSLVFQSYNLEFIPSTVANHE